MFGGEEFDLSRHRPRHQRFELFDMSVEPERAEAGENQLRHVVRALGARFVRHRGQDPQLRPQGVGAGDGAGRGLMPHLERERVPGEAEDRRRGLLGLERAGPRRQSKGRKGASIGSLVAREV